jgi:dTDP-4-amino-4,6-dideoxygalactose transaminase
MLGMPEMRFTTSGRASILLAVEALGIGRGDRVLLPTYHCPTMVSPTVERGAVPLFYPIDERGSPMLAWLQAQDLRGVRALLVVHLFGLPQPMAVLRRWCDEKHIALIEDCAHALFGRSGERDIGRWGDVAIGSLTKFLPLPEGGCLVVNSGARSPALRPCSATAQVKAAVDILEVGARHGRLAGLNAVIAWPLAALRGLRRRRQKPAASTNTDTAAVADADPDSFALDVTLAHRSLSRASRWIAEMLPRERIVLRRRQRYAQLAERLAGHAGLRALLPALPPDCAPYVFPLWVAEPDPGYAELRRLEMPVSRWDWLWPGVPALAGDHGLAWSHHVLQLSCHQDLTDTDLDRLVDTLLRLYAAAPATAPAATSPPPTNRIPA